ncbi:DUF2934 domain-containing protein [Caballeronia sp. S22]|uniref:DUF2934 domain-containing protein n=1 Tax=Caballeronia sp. S22 TaxID=3137182 RepID=UPI003531361F
MQPKSNLALPEEAIRTRAYLLWEADGCVHGRDDHYWREAIVQLLAEGIQPSPSHSAEPHMVVVEKAPKRSTTGKGVVRKVAKKTVEADDTAKAEAEKEANKKAATKATTKAAGKAPHAAVDPKTATKKFKTAKKAREGSGDEAAVPTPARPKKPRKSVSAESKVSAQ